MTSSQEALLSKIGSSTWPFEAPERAEDEQSKIESVSSSKAEEIKSLNASETQLLHISKGTSWPTCKTNAREACREMRK